jgi:hypothetical protein
VSDDLAEISGSVCIAVLAVYYHYQFEKTSGASSSTGAWISGLGISGSKAAGSIMAILTLYQVLSQSLGIPQSFVIGLWSCLGIAGTWIYLISVINGLDRTGKALLSFGGCVLLFIYTIDPLKKEWDKESSTGTTQAKKTVPNQPSPSNPPPT